MNRHRFHGFDYSATASFGLLRAAYDATVAKGDNPVVGQVFTSDSFYHPRPELTDILVDHGIVAVEMEASALYTLAAGFKRQALAICTVSDHVKTGEETTSQEREQTFGDMVEIALEAMLATPLPWRSPSRTEPRSRATAADQAHMPLTARPRAADRASGHGGRDGAEQRASSPARSGRSGGSTASPVRT